MPNAEVATITGFFFCIQSAMRFSLATAPPWKKFVRWPILLRWVLNSSTLFLVPAYTIAGVPFGARASEMASSLFVVFSTFSSIFGLSNELVICMGCASSSVLQISSLTHLVAVAVRAIVGVLESLFFSPMICL